MRGAFGKIFSLTAFGESHGVAIGGIVQGCPPGIEISSDDLQKELDLRKPGSSIYTSGRQESDSIQILSGIFKGKTTGTPIGLLIENEDAKPKDYANLKDVFRPSHGDYTYAQKYGIRDYRGGGHSSARITAIWVAAGAIAKKILDQIGIEIKAYVSQVGSIKAQNIDWNEIEKNAFFFPDKEKLPEIEKLIKQLRRKGDSIGARITLVANGVPPGLGDPIFNKLDASIAHAMMTINAVKGVEIGQGFSAIDMLGSEHRDEITPEGFLSNNAGGILGGISSGQPITVNIALKPTPSIRIPSATITTSGEATTVITKGRHDPCVGFRAVPVAKAMLRLVIIDHWLAQQTITRGQNDC